MKYLAVPALALLACATAWADPATDGQWHGSASLGGSLSSGNTRNRVLTGMADAARATNEDKISLFGQVNYGSTTNASDQRTTTADDLRLGGRYDRELGAELFGFGLGEYQTNKISGLRSRESAQVGAGYHLVRTAENKWDVFAGVGYAHATYTNLPAGSGATALIGEESSHQLSKTSLFKQRLVMQFAGGELGRLSTWDLSLATSIAGGWTSNIGLSIRNASVVAPGMKKTDTLLTVGLGYKF